MNFTFAVSFIHISLDRDNRTSRNARCQVWHFVLTQIDDDIYNFIIQNEQNSKLNR